MKNRIKLIIVSLLVSAAAFAQGDFRPTQQMFSRINANPSAVGNNENIQLFTATRLQWVEQGLGESPVSTVVNAHYYLNKIKSGFGLSFSYDELGIANQTMDVKFVYAFNIDLREDMLLSLGLSAGAINKRFDPTNHVVVDPNDPVLPGDITSVWNFDLDFGLELSYKYLLVGLSMTHLPNISKEYSSLTAPSHIYAYVRGNIPLPMDFSLIPAVAFTNVGAANVYALGEEAGKSIVQENILDFGVTAMYKGKYYFGVGYRGGITENYSNNVAYLMAGFEWHWLRVGYCCDISVDAIDYSTSTHEIMLSFSIPTKKDYVWP